MTNYSYISTMFGNNYSDDDALSVKIEQFSAALKACQNIEASFKLMKDQSWSNRLGMPDEMKQAQEISQNSLNKAIKSLAHENIQDMENFGLMSNSEAKQFRAVKAKSELEKQRNNRKQQNHKKPHPKK